MKSHLVVLALLGCAASFAGAQTHLADGSRVIRGNRLMSARSSSGKQLHGQDRELRPIEILLDAAMDEPQWKSAAAAAPFLNAHGRSTMTSVRVLYDAENLYLFWAVDEPGGLTDTLQQNDGVITADDYVQIKLKPWLPSDVTVARDYYYTIAVNPSGHYWDAYFDPCLGGHFFSSWNSNVQVATKAGQESWTAEMRVPFSGLDHSSDPGWRWAVSFVHSSVGRDGKRTSCTPELDVLVEQGVQVRRKNLVDYYWTRPEFMQEVKPPQTRSPRPRVGIVELNGLPKADGRLDAGLWQGVRALDIAYSDRSGGRLTAKAARARIGYQDSHLALALEADGAKTLPPTRGAARLGKGMEAQTASVNGVFVDQGLFVDECFWILMQPRDPRLDQMHQTYYLVLVNNRGEVRGVRYDQFGRADRSWIPHAEVDLYNTAGGWGAELKIALDSFDLPVNAAQSWGFNLFRNRLLVDQADARSELQAWAYTATDFLNPETFGLLDGMAPPDLGVVSAGLKRLIEELQRKIAARSATHRDLTARLAEELKALRLNDREALRAAASRLEQVDRRLGIAEAIDSYRAVAHPSRGGHAIFDLQFQGESGWAVGALGTILTTRDGGQTWESVKLESDADLYRVFFVNESEGWAAGGRIRMGATNDLMRHDERGGFGYIFHTKDGGRTWECQYGERGRHLFGLHFVNRQLGFACGELGFLLKTTDGGQNWHELPTTGSWRWLYGITFLDEQRGYAVGESETVLETRNGGRTWEHRSVPADRQFYGFRPFYRDVVFQGRTGCIVGQNGTILVTGDEGQTWKNAATFVDPQIRELLDFSRVTFPTPQVGYVVGELGTRIMVTEDAGRSWSLRPVANSDWLRAVWAGPTGRVVAGGERETIVESRNRGYDWNTLRGDGAKVDVLVMLAHGDDAPIQLGAFYAHYGLEKGKRIVDVEVLRDAHSVEYRGEIYNLEHHRAVRLTGVRTTTYFDEFENGNNGCDYYHYTQRLWEGEQNVVRHMVAVIRAYRPDVVILHDGVFGDYDKPGHKLSGRAGIPAFETSGGGDVDHWPELTRLGLARWQAKKLYAVAGESYPPTLDLAPIGKSILAGTGGTCLDWSEYALRNFQSQGVYHARNGRLSLIKSLVTVPQPETSVFDGLQ